MPLSNRSAGVLIKEEAIPEISLPEIDLSLHVCMKKSCEHMVRRLLPTSHEKKPENETCFLEP